MTSVALPEIVLVEDTFEDEVLSLRSIANSGIDCNVTVRRDGAEALDYLLDIEKPLPRLIILDYNLPKFNGLEVLIQLRQSEVICIVPVVIFSGNNRGEELAECYLVGANSCVQKPSNAKEYMNQLSLIVHYWFNVNLSTDLQNFLSRTG